MEQVKFIMVNKDGMRYVDEQLIKYSKCKVDDIVLFAYLEKIEMGWLEGQTPQCEIPRRLSNTGEPVIIFLENPEFYDVFIGE